MSELTLTVLRFGLLIALWLFVFSIVGVLRGDLYGTRVTSRPVRGERTGRRRNPEPAPIAPAVVPARGGIFSRRAKAGPRQLVVTDGPLTGTSLPLRPQGTLIGRSPECALVLDDDYASGRHARIFQDENGWWVEDLTSTNGTWLDDHRLGVQPEPVGEGSTLRIGRTIVELQH